LTKRRTEIIEMKVTLRRKDGLDEAIGGLKVGDLEATVQAEVVAALNEELETLSKDEPGVLKVKEERLVNVKVLDAMTKIPHGLGKTPTEYHVFPKANMTWFERMPPDEGYLYLEGSAAFFCDIVVKG